MTAYRVSEFTSPTPEKVAATCEAITDIGAKTGAEMIDIVMMDDGKGLVIARYSSEATMEAASSLNKEAFGVLVKAGVVDGSSIVSRTGEKIFAILVIRLQDQRSGEKTDGPSQCNSRLGHAAF